MSARSRSYGCQVLAGLIGSMTAALGYSANYACSGPVNGVTAGPNGVVAAESAGGQHWGYFCQLNTTVNNVDADGCKGILSVLLAAQASGKSVSVWYTDDHDCTWHGTNGAWTWLATWYWGPTINN